MKNDPFKEYEKVEKVSFHIKGEKKDSKLFIRLDPLLGEHSLHSTSISEDRAKRPEIIKHKEKDTKKEGCIFCGPKIYEVTPEPRIDHGKDDLFTPGGIPVTSVYRSCRPVISVPNLFPFSPDHYVTVFADHKVDITDWVEKDLVNYLETSFYFANKFKDKKAEAMWDIINHGATAGASQTHPHAQRGTLDRKFSISLEQSALAKRAEELGKDPFEVYMAKVRDSPYFIFENDSLFICAPFAPQLPDQVDIISKERFNTLLETSSDYRKGLAGHMAGVLQSLGKDRGVTDFNLNLHQNFFDVKDNYRLHWHIFPRNKNHIAGFELNHCYVVSVFPHVTAEALRKHFGVSGYD